MKLLQTVDNVRYELVAEQDLHRIKEITVYIKNIEKIKKCARECPALSGLQKLMGGVYE